MSTAPGLDLLVITAFELEVAPWLKQLKASRRITGDGFVLHEGQIGDWNVGVAKCSPRPRLVQKACLAMLLAHRPNWIISAGFAVSIDRLEVGRIVWATACSAFDAPEWVTLAGPPKEVANNRLVEGKLISGPRWLPNKEQVDQLKSEAVVALDRQSYWVGQFCQQHGVSFRSLRVIVAGPDSPQPQFDLIFGPSIVYSAGYLIGSFLSGSGRAATAMRIKGEAAGHAESLVEWLLPNLGGLVN